MKEKFNQKKILMAIIIIVIILLIVAINILIGKKETKISENSKIEINKPIIPNLFYEVPGLNNVEEGFVISDIENDTKDEGNQFVWIPVESEEQYRRIKFDTDELFFNSLKDDTNYLPNRIEVLEGKKEVEVEKEIVLNAKGFYIGRYEAGKENKEGTDVLVCKKNVPVWDMVEQEKAKEVAKNFKEGTKTGLITGIQWDRVMEFIGNKATVTNNNRHTQKLERTGSNSEDNICNIYDLEGNYWEYVAEKNSFDENFPCIYRGGNYRYTYAASYRNFYNGKAYNNITFRIVLYV